ncbi:MAG: DUF6503 family protein [Flavobacteriaceae bacterium]
MRLILILGFALLMTACKEKIPESLTAQKIIDEAIQRAGGELYGCSHIDFVFRDRLYSLEYNDNRKILKRSFELDSTQVVDIKRNGNFERMVDNQTVKVPDTTARKFSNSINSVHYFAYLPYGLNDGAVNKKLLGERKIKGEEYYVIEVTFNQTGGGDDFEDVYIYWIHKEHFTPNYLAYEFHVNGGGMRFREALNERYVEGIRFVDYSNYKPKETASIYEIDRLYQQNKLTLLSTIELEEIRVNVDNCN